MSLVLVKPSIEQLRELVGAISDAPKECSAFSAYADGFPVGALIELAGHGKTECVAQFLCEHEDFKVAWIESEVTVNPYALLQRGVRLENILFIEAKNELAWCIQQALQSGCFRVLIVSDCVFTEKDLRRYQLLSERSAAHFFVLSEVPHQSWVPKLQLEVVRAASGFKLNVLRKRGAI